MKALLCKQWGEPETLVLDDVADLSAAKGHVVIEVQAASVNFPDTLIIQNLYQFKPDLPFSPGGECAGIVREVGEGVENLKVGDRVLALTIFGSFAEQVLADARMVVTLPDSVDFATAAAFSMTYGTSYHALVDRGQLQAGESLLVLGAAGGVGLAAVEIGKQCGAKVIAAASSDEKLAICKEPGAGELTHYTSKDWRARLAKLTAGTRVEAAHVPRDAGTTREAHL